MVVSVSMFIGYVCTKKTQKATCLGWQLHNACNNSCMWGMGSITQDLLVKWCPTCARAAKSTHQNNIL